MKKKVIKFTLIQASVFTFLIFLSKSIYAQTPVDLRDFIAGPDFVPHSLSSGEQISFSSEGDCHAIGQAARQYKNANYEQFCIGANGVYRQEDTSWAISIGNRLQNAHCKGTLDKAVYTSDPGCTTYTPGSQVTTDGAWWAPAGIGSMTTGQSYSYITHNPWQIVTINNNILQSGGGKIYCEIEESPYSDRYKSPNTCGSTISVSLTYYDAGEYEFCTGLKNNEPVIAMGATSGPGSDEKIIYMRGWGIVGFESPFMTVGLMGTDNYGNTADPSGCTAPGAFGPGASGVQCEDEFFPEFHSLRPYPACPLPPDIMDTSFLLCGNDLITQETLEIRYGEDLPDGISLIDCTEDGQNIICNYEITNRNIPIRVGLSEADLPIMGLTEDPFSTEGDEPWPHQRIPDSVTPAQRMNEYVSWYLNGTIARAEDPLLAVTNDYPEKSDNISDPKFEKIFRDTRLLINFSGPLRKLLPWRIQVREREKQIFEASGFGGPDVAGNIRHNQIVGCTYGLSIPNFWDIFNIDEIGGIPGPCYEPKKENDFIIPDLFQRQIHRLSDWLEGGVNEELDKWNRLPPYDEDIGTKYENFQEYWKEYRRWRGQSCTPSLDLGDIPLDQIPGIGSILGSLLDIVPNLYLCYDNPLKFNYWSNLFSYIPFSSTEDRTGYAEGHLDTALTQQPPSDANITDINFTPNPGTILPDDGKMRFLYFPHMQESAELGYLLQQTFLTKGEGGFSNINEQGYYNTERCEYLDTRKNPGDDLYGGDFGQEGLPWIQPENDERTIDGNITYSGTFQCSFYLAEPVCDGIGYPGQVHCNLDECQPYLCTELGSWQPVGEEGNFPCNGTAGACTSSSTFSPPNPGLCTINIKTATSIYVGTPKAEEVWDRLVNGNQSVFRRIYPKVGAEAPVEEIEDIPAEANASYSSEDGNVQVFAGNPAAARPGSSAKIFFPHIGSIYDYFLKGIQKALRPKDIQTTQSGPSSTPPPPQNTDCPINCNQNVPDSEIPTAYLGTFKQNIIRLADAWYAGAGRHFAKECYNDVVKRSLNAGYNPAFVLTIWLAESAASNYNQACTTQDFGINRPEIAADFNEQIRWFFNLTNIWNTTYPECIDCNISTGKCTNGYTYMENWTHLFKSGDTRNAAGECIPDPPSQSRLADYQNIWDWVAPACPFPQTPFHNTCPNIN